MSSIPIISAAIGAAILLFGRKLFWLFVAALGFALGLEGLLFRLIHAIEAHWRQVKRTARAEAHQVAYRHAAVQWLERHAVAICGILVAHPLHRLGLVPCALETADVQAPGGRLHRRTGRQRHLGDAEALRAIRMHDQFIDVEPIGGERFAELLAEYLDASLVAAVLEVVADEQAYGDEGTDPARYGDEGVVPARSAQGYAQGDGGQDDQDDQ